MSQIDQISANQKKISWSWLFLSFLTFVLIVSQVINSYQKDISKKNTYLEEKMVLDQVLLQKTQETIISPKIKKSKLNSLMDSSISLLIEDKNKNPEAAMLYAIMRKEQGYKINASDISILEKQKDERYQSVYQIYNQQNQDKEQLKHSLNLFKGNNIVDRLICVHIYEKLGQSNKRQQILPIEYWFPFVQVTGLYVFAGLLGVILFFVYHFKRKKGEYKPIGIPFTPSNFDEFNQGGKKVITAAIIMTLCPLAFMIFSKSIMGCFIIGTLMMVSLKIIKDPWLQSLKGKMNLLNQIKWGISASLINIPVISLFGLFSILLQNFFPAMTHAATDIILSGKDPNRIIAMAFLAVFMAPIMEEIVFRGLILPSLIFKYKNPIWAVIITNFIFAAVHPQGIAGWPALFSVGTMASLTFIQTGSIVPSIILHMIHNGTLLIMTYTLSLHL